MKLELPRQIFEKYSKVTFQENPFSGSLVFFMQTDEQTELIVTFRKYANTPKTRMKLTLLKYGI